MSTINNTITSTPVFTTVHAPIATVWNLFTTPSHLNNWFTPSPLHTLTTVENNFVDGGNFHFSFLPVNETPVFGFDFVGTYTNLIPSTSFTYSFVNGYTWNLTFNVVGSSVEIVSLLDFGTVTPSPEVVSHFENLLLNFNTYVSNNI